MTLTLLQWILAGAGAFLTGLSKSGIAGLGILSVALFASVFPVRESVGLLLVILVVGDVAAVLQYRREASWNHLVRLFPWAFAGIVFGALLFNRMNDEAVRLVLGLLLTLLTVAQMSGLLRVPDEPSQALAPVAGVASGVTTMIANAAGPIMVLYLLAMRLPKRVFVGTAAWFFLIVNVSKLPFSYGLGLIGPTDLMVLLPLIPCVLVGSLTGPIILARINQRIFERLALVFTFIAGVRLLFL